MSATEQQVQSHYQATADAHRTQGVWRKTGDDLLQFVICLIGSEEFAVDVLSVQEINRIVEVTRVPKTPPYVEGVHQSAGPHHSRTGPQKTLWPDPGQQTTQTRIVVVSGTARLVGLIVDSVEEVLRVPRSAIEPPPSVGTMAGAEFTQGVGRIDDRLLDLVDLSRLLLAREAA